MGVVKLVVTVVVESLLGLTIAAGILAIGIPVLLRGGVIAPGDTRGSLLIASVVIVCIAAAILRPGSALRERRKR